jgi:hypothetical protein
MRSADGAFPGSADNLMRCSFPSFRLLGLANARCRFVPQLFISEIFRQLPLCNRAFTRAFQHCCCKILPGIFRLRFLWLRLTTEVATGEYRGYGRAGTDNERMMDGSVRKLQGRPKDQRLTRCPREKLLKIGEGFVRLGGIRLRHAQSGHAITAPRN